MRCLLVLVALAACVPSREYGQVERYGMLQLRVPRRTGAEPAVAEVWTPSGASVRVESYDEGDDTYVRLAPRELGSYTFVVRRGDSDVLRGGFTAAPSSRPGPVRRDPKEPRRLVREDGTTFFMLGENRINVYDPSWNVEALGGPEYVARMASYGMTTLRVFIFSDVECEECEGGVQLGALETQLGHFDSATAHRFDAIMKAAEENDIQVIITLFAVGFTKGETWKSWHDNPYSKERGGPAAEPEDFFTDKTARTRAAERLRYVLARWGYSAQLLAIDLLNEPEWDGPIPEGDWMPWARDLARFAKTHDGREPMITVGPIGLSSNIGGADERAWYQARENDIVQWHLYGERFYEPGKLAVEMTRRVREVWEYDRPVLCGEFGYGGEDHATHEHTHVGLWSAIFSGAGVLSHTAPVFNIDSDQPMTRSRALHFKALRDFLDALPKGWAAPRFDAEVTGNAQAWQLATGDGGSGAVWLLAGGDTSRGVAVRLPQINGGRYRVTWVDDVSGARLVDTEVAADLDGLRIVSPAFTRHVAARYVRL